MLPSSTGRCVSGLTRATATASPQIRAFRTSTSALHYSTSYNEEDVIPDFYAKHKQQRAQQGSTSSTESDSSLMPTLTDSIMSGDVIATTRRLRAKVPVEHFNADGHVIHPSGFVVPGPGHTSTSDVARAKERARDEDVDRKIQTAAVAERVLESDVTKVKATHRLLTHKVPFEVREPDGTFKHPSGFVPPTPAHKFRHSVSRVVGRQRVRESPPPGAVLLMGRAVHTATGGSESEVC